MQYTKTLSVCLTRSSVRRLLRFGRAVVAPALNYGMLLHIEGEGREPMKHCLRFGRLLFVAGVLSATPALAQDGSDGIEATQRGRAIAPAKFMEAADSYLVGMRDQMSQGLEALSSARAEMDAIRLQCVSDKVTSMKGVLRISEDAFISLQEAMATRATERARYEFQKIRTSQNKMMDLSQAVRSCVGSESTTPGEGKLTVQVDAAVAVRDPYYGSPDLFFSPDSAMAESSTQDSSLGDDDSSSSSSGGSSLGGDSTTSTIVTRPPVVSGYQPES